jgi:glycosyltransferase involved in cell wall biosynthesis
MKTPGALLYITGTTSGELTEKVSSLDPELQTRIKLVGEVSSDELKRLLGTVRVVSVPSIYVAPVASPSAIEGLASGTPVAASRSISTEVINDGLNSVFCDFQQAEQTAQVFDRLMTDNEWWQSLSEQGLMSATNFSSQSVAEKYVDLCSRR